MPKYIIEREIPDAWEDLLLPLETRGLYRQQGLELLIHDGGKGLIAALNLIYPTVPHQRCTFHKLRNLWHSIQAPDGLSRDQRQQFKLDILQQAQAIFYAPNTQEAQHLQQILIQQFQHTQPQFIDTLQRDWHETIAFFKILKRFPDWRRTALRTTSLLERVNRMLRRLFRPKGAFHSAKALLACVNSCPRPKTSDLNFNRNGYTTADPSRTQKCSPKVLLVDVYDFGMSKILAIFTMRYV